LTKSQASAYENIGLWTIFWVKYVKGVCGLCVKRPICIDTEDDVHELYIIKAIE
jgi:hypothetical protein